jgi:hypothetical protein
VIGRENVLFGLLLASALLAFYVYSKAASWSGMAGVFFGLPLALIGLYEWWYGRSCYAPLATHAPLTVPIEAVIGAALLAAVSYDYSTKAAIANWSGLAGLFIGLVLALVGFSEWQDGRDCYYLLAAPMETIIGAALLAAAFYDMSRHWEEDEKTRKEHEKAMEDEKIRKGHEKAMEEEKEFLKEQARERLEALEERMRARGEDV